LTKRASLKSNAMKRLYRGALLTAHNSHITIQKGP
jgi:hypothetical protein